MTIINGTFDTNVTGWSTSGNGTVTWESGKAHVRSNSTYGSWREQFFYFSQRFLVDQPTLSFDIQVISAGDTDYACGRAFSYPGENFPIHLTCGWTVTDDAGNVIGHDKGSTTLTTVVVNLANYIGQYVTISFIAGAARAYGYYYDLLIDNVENIPGIKFNAQCSDTGEYCNADLCIDNKCMGTTPYYTMLNVGIHNYLLLRKGYDRFNGTLNITPSDIVAARSTGINIDTVINPGYSGIINPTFDTDLSGWTVSDPNRIVWEAGHVLFQNPSYSSPVYMNQTFVVDKDTIFFDWVVLGACSCFNKSWKIYVDNNIVQSNSFGLGSGCRGTTSGREKINVLKYIGKAIKFEITTDSAPCYGFNMQVDNVINEDTGWLGISNGYFDQGFNGWEVTGDVRIDDCWGQLPHCSGNSAEIRTNSILQQSFRIDKCTLKFDWGSYSSSGTGYTLYIDNILFISKELLSSAGTEIIDVSGYVGHPAIISFYTNYYLYIDNVETVTYPFNISAISYPSGAEIYVDDNDTGQTTGNTPIIVTAGLTEGQHVVTFKLAGYTDYVETVNIIRCQTSYVTAVFEGCIAFVTIPSGAKICIDNADTGRVTPYTFCGYSPGDSRAYALLLKDYRPKNDVVTFGSGKGIFINEVLAYNTGSAQFNVVPNGAKIIIDGTDTGKITPDTIDNIPIGYHSYEIRLDGYYSLTGSFRSIVDTIKQISGTLQQITGIANGTFDTNISGWITTISNPSNGNVVWDNGRAHLYGHDIALTVYQDFVITEDALVFDYAIGEIRYTCDAGWNVTIDPGTPEARTIASWCGRYGGRFEADVSLYKNKNARLLFYMNCNRRFSWGCDTWIDNVGNVPKPIRAITIDTLCAKLSTCPTIGQIIERCYADIYVDGIFKGTNPIIIDNLSIGNHSYKVRNQGYKSIDTNTQDVTGNISFSQGISTHTYIDNIFLPTGIVPAEGCIRFESIPPGLHIYIDGQNTGKVTPDTVCNLSHSLSSTVHSYELRLLNSTYQGSFTLGPGFGEYIYVELYGKIQFDTIPEGASVILDGVDIGAITPYNTGNIPIGIHIYTIRLANFQEQTCQIEVIKDQTAIVNLELVSAEGCAYIDSCPTTDITIDGISQGTTPLSICQLTGHHEYTLSRIGYENYTETIDMPSGRGINRKINLNRKIGVPFTDSTKVCSSVATAPYDGLPPYYPDDPAYTGKYAYPMGDGAIITIDAQGYDVAHLHATYHNYWIGSTGGGPMGCTLYIYQSDTPSDCATIPSGAELIMVLGGGGWGSTLYYSQILFNSSLNISKRYIIMNTSVYACGYWSCGGDGSSLVWIMEGLPTICAPPITTKCKKICTIKRDEGIYSKERYCYLGEGIFAKK